MTRILIVDDQELARDTIREMLEAAGFDVVEAVCGLEGIDRQRADPADLVITDIVMPCMEGIELITRLRSLDAGVKIIAISGASRHQGQAPLHMALAAGANRVLEKPFGSKDLLDVVRVCLEDRHP